MNDLGKTSVSIGVEESLKQLIMNYTSKSLKTDPIKSDSIDFIN